MEDFINEVMPKFRATIPEFFKDLLNVGVDVFEEDEEKDSTQVFIYISEKELLFDLIFGDEILEMVEQNRKASGCVIVTHNCCVTKILKSFREELTVILKRDEYKTALDGWRNGEFNLLGF